MPAPEDPAQRDHRLREEARDNGLRRFQHVATFVLGWGLVIAVGIAAGRVAFDNALEHAAPVAGPATTKTCTTAKRRPRSRNYTRRSLGAPLR